MKTPTPVWTWLPSSTDPVLAGTLEIDDGRGLFRYDQPYMDLPGSLPLDPVGLRFTRKKSPTPVLTNGGLPGVILDATPAGYGADCLNARAKRQLMPLELLEQGPPDGVGAIEVCRDIERKLRWRPHALDQLLDQVKELDDHAPPSRAIRRLLGDEPTSAGGERPKVTIVHDNRLWIAKLQDRGDAPHMPAREFVVMQLAGEVNLNVPAVEFRREGEREIYLVERFDRWGPPSRPGRYLFASAYTVLGLDEKSTRGDARRSYPIFAQLMGRWITDEKALQEDREELWRRMAFNALVGNHDDHPRNHGLINTGTGWRLSKAFDIIPFPEFSGTLAMDVTAEGSSECSLENLLASAPHFGLAIRDAASWLSDAAVLVAEHWRAKLIDNGVVRSYLDTLATAFRLSDDIAADESIIDNAVLAVQEHAARRTRRRPQPW